VIRFIITRAPRRAGCGRPPTAASAGCLFSDSMSRSRAIGALAVAPSDPSIRLGRYREAWAIRDQRCDRRRHLTSRWMPARPGRTWGSTRRAASDRILVHPANPDIVLACAIGRFTGSQRSAVCSVPRRPAEMERVAVVDENTAARPSRMDRRTPARSSPARGRSRCIPGRC